MKMSQLCNRTVVIAEPQESVRDVAMRMRDTHVGCVVVVQGPAGARIPVGVLTDRDIVLDVVAPGRDPATTPVSAAMTPDPHLAREEEDVYDVLQQLRARGLRRVPVVNERGILQGIFTFDDLVEWTAEHLLELTRLVQRELNRERRGGPASAPRSA